MRLDRGCKSRPLINRLAKKKKKKKNLTRVISSTIGSMPKEFKVVLMLLSIRTLKLKYDVNDARAQAWRAEQIYALFVVAVFVSLLARERRM